MKHLLSILFILFFGISIQAATFTVTRNDDRNETCDSGVDCSLREAIKAANTSASDDEINFASNVTYVTLTNEIAIVNNGRIVVNGNGANVLTIDGGVGTNRIFYVNNNSATISRVTLTGGNGLGAVFGSDSRDGGAIYASRTFLNLDRVHLKDNSAENAGGGAAFFDSAVFINNSTISGNSASGGGGFYSSIGSNTTVTNSTLSGDTGNGFYAGGGFYADGRVTVRNSTITSNIGGGIRLDGRETLNLANTIIAGNSGTSTPDIYFYSARGAAIISNGNNLIDDSANTNSPITYQSSDILNVNPLLGQLQNNGGTTPTHALLSGSPAINKGNNSNARATDQRGLPRIVDSIIDIGAFEVQASVTQPPDLTECTYTLSTSSQDFLSTGGTSTIFVNTQQGCSISVSYADDYLTLSYAPGGLSLSVAANTGTARTAQIIIAGQTFTVNQAGGKGRKRLRVFNMPQQNNDSN